MIRGQKRRVAFHTLGCKVNQYDTRAMAEKFLEKGYQIEDFDKEADVYVINTCTVTSLGDKKSRQMIRRANRLNPKGIIAVVGCYAQTAPEEVLSIPEVDLILGTRDRDGIVELVEQVLKTGERINQVHDIMEVKEFEETPISSYEERTRASLKIQEGCDRYCSYCIIPYARGRIRSRKSKDVLDEVRTLVKSGFQEFVLTGIHLASYGRDIEGANLISLMKDIGAIDGVNRIRLGSLEPTLLTEDFVKSVSQMPKVCRHFHLSLQSGCDDTLKRMNRRYSAEEYRAIVQRLRGYIPDAAITTDIMVGFPGETDEEYKNTYDFVRGIGFSRIHVFKYSPRDGTPAAKFRDQVPEGKKEDRSRRLIDLGREMESKYLKSFEGKVEKVLFEEESRDMEGFYEGYTDHYIRVMVPGNEELIDTIAPVKLDRERRGKMLGTLYKPFSS